jgi:hypothetical protein
VPPSLPAGTVPKQGMASWPSRGASGVSTATAAPAQAHTTGLAQQLRQSICQTIPEIHTCTVLASRGAFLLASAPLYQWVPVPKPRPGIVLEARLSVIKGALCCRCVQASSIWPETGSRQAAIAARNSRHWTVSVLAPACLKRGCASEAWAFEPSPRFCDWLQLWYYARRSDASEIRCSGSYMHLHPMCDPTCNDSQPSLLPRSQSGCRVTGQQHV